MDEIKSITYYDRLRRRQLEVEMTLRHLEKERHEVEENTASMNPAAYEHRVSLLNRLSTWYRKESQQIEKTLGRVSGSRYGFCLACHEPIESDRLATYPETDFCLDCQEYRERLKAG